MASCITRSAFRASSKVLKPSSSQCARTLSTSCQRSAIFTQMQGTFMTANHKRTSRPRHSALKNPPLTRSMFIQTEVTPNEDSLKFIPGVDVMGDGTAEFMDTRSALISPLAVRLMGIDGVKSVFYGPDFVTVSKEGDVEWSVMKPEIYSTLMEFFSSGQNLFRSKEDRDAAGPQDMKILDTDSEVVAMIKEILDTRVRPAIMEDGGDLEYRGFVEDADAIVKIKLKGSCRGCSSSMITLKSGIERMLMHYVPEVKGVEEVIDQEEEVANEEFAKLESRLAQKSSGLAQYMSA